MRKKKEVAATKNSEEKTICWNVSKEGFSARKSRAVLRKWNARLRCSTTEVDSAIGDRLLRPVALVSTLFSVLVSDPQTVQL